MSLGASSEGSFVIDHGYDERLSPHVTPDDVTPNVTPGTNGPTPLNAHENGHDTQEHYNGGNTSAVTAAATEANSLGSEVAAPPAPPEHEISEEKNEVLSKREAEHVEQEQAPERDSNDGLPEACATGIPTEEKEAISAGQEETKQLSTTETSKWRTLC